MKEREIQVYLQQKEECIFVGTLRFSYAKGKEIESFEYDDRWIETECFSIDPDLELFRGRQTIPEGKTLFGCFSDCAPDRWGRKLIDRQQLLSKEKRHLFESDYLLGVSDYARFGALRFFDPLENAFLAADNSLSIPPLEKIGELEDASLALELKTDINEKKWLNMLLSPGSSLGGSRPKANVMGKDGELWLAKFPSRQDEYDIGAYEMFSHDLAKNCGISVPEASLLKRSSKYGSIYLSKRFDRVKGDRVFMSSAMTLLGKKDGEDASYLDMADLIKERSLSPKRDLLELFKRIAFSIFIKNSDDHLRNHCFYVTKKGISLTPMYDVNPCFYPARLSLSIDGETYDFDLSPLIKVSNVFGLSQKEAQEIISQMKGVINGCWLSLAEKYNLDQRKLKTLLDLTD